VELRLIEVDGSPERVGGLVDALVAALDGGPAVLPLALGARPWVRRAKGSKGWSFTYHCMTLPRSSPAYG